MSSRRSLLCIVHRWSAPRARQRRALACSSHQSRKCFLQYAGLHHCRVVARGVQQTRHREDSAIALENAVDELRDQFRNNHYDRLEQSAYSPRAGVSFIDVLNRLERIGDHILNVNESAAGKSLKATRIAANR